MAPFARPLLVELVIGDDPDSWRAVGFDIAADGRLVLGQATVRLVGTAAGRGFQRWSWQAGDDEAPRPTDLDGLATTWTDPPNDEDAPARHPNGAHHPNGSTTLDHVVVFSPDPRRTTAAYEAVGLDLRRIRPIGSREQRFFRSGEIIVELVGPTLADDVPGDDGSSGFFGLVANVDDPDALAADLGERVGAVKDAVQAGRRITTVRTRDLDISVPLAFMTPERR